MNDDEFEGSLVLEKLAEIGKKDEFFEAIDSDDFAKAKLLLESAQIDEETIYMTMKKMINSDHKH